MKTFLVSIEQQVLVTVDEIKFDAAFMMDFRKQFYDFKTLEEHVQHLAQLQARGLACSKFIEGYGDTCEMGIVTENDDRAHFEIGDPEPAEVNTLHASLIDMQRQIAAERVALAFRATQTLPHSPQLADARVAELEAENAKLRDLAQCLIDNDPDESIADGGHVVLDLWRHDARAALTKKARP